MAETTALLYLNGLGDGTSHWFEQRELAALEARGWEVVHGRVNWREEVFPDMLYRQRDRARGLARHAGSLIIAGYSAGGSLAYNLLPAFRDEPDVQIVNIAGRLRRGNYPEGHRKHLNQAAHLEGRNPSPSFRESVEQCEDEVLTSLTGADVSRLSVVKPKHDFVVPMETMDVEGVEPVVVPAHHHLTAGVHGLRILPDLAGAA